MLLQFSVENFLSFDEEQVFSMVASTGDQQHSNHMVDGKGGLALRAAAIYGPNASGKSNLVEAIRFARELIVNGTRRSQSIPVRPFKLRAGSHERPSKFEFNFRAKDVLYNYGFRVMKDRVTEEWLFATGFKKKETVLFERSTSAEGKVEVEVGSALTESRKKQFYEFLAQGTRPNQLFLTETVEHNVESVMPIITWFDTGLTVITTETMARDLMAGTLLNTGFRSFLSTLLNSAGTGVRSASVKATLIDISIQDQEVQDAMAELKGSDSIVFLSDDGMTTHYLAKDASGRPVRLDMMLNHQMSYHGEAVFELYEESDGTQRLIQLAPALYGLISLPQRVVIIDELDRRFHPHLSRLFLDTALDGCPPDSSNQLIFTTHDTNLLDLDLLRRDEIWFVEKNKAGASHIYSLAEFKIRPDLKVEKGYLNGRFGAIPFITPIERLGWKNDDPASDDKAAA